MKMSALPQKTIVITSLPNQTARNLYHDDMDDIYGEGGGPRKRRRLTHLTPEEKMLRRYADFCPKIFLIYPQILPKHLNLILTLQSQTLLSRLTHPFSISQGQLTRACSLVPDATPSRKLQNKNIFKNISCLPLGKEADFRGSHHRMRT